MHFHRDTCTFTLETDCAGSISSTYGVWHLQTGSNLDGECGFFLVLRPVNHAVVELMVCFLEFSKSRE